MSSLTFCTKIHTDILTPDTFHPAYCYAAVLDFENYTSTKYNIGHSAHSSHLMQVTIKYRSESISSMYIIKSRACKGGTQATQLEVTMLEVS